MIQRLLKEIELDERWLIADCQDIDAETGKYKFLRAYTGGPYPFSLPVIDRATFDRVCAALVVAVKQRDTWMNEAAQAFDFKQDLALERENETLAKILTGKTKE